MDRRNYVTISPKGRLVLLGVAVVAFIAFVMGASAGADSSSGGGPVGFVRRLAPPQPSMAALQEKAFQNVTSYTDYIASGSPTKNEVALTFDDGPSTYTPQILKVLNQTGTPATFFNVGKEYASFGVASQAAAVNGNVVGNHTWDHSAMNTLDRASQTSELDQTTAAMASVGIPTPKLFRPPYGVYDQTTVNLMKTKKMLMVLWSIDSEDWTLPGADTIVQNILGIVKAGDIILMHDGGGDRSETVAALPRVIKGLKDKGLTPVTVPQLLLDDPPPRDQPPPPGLGHG